MIVVLESKDIFDETPLHWAARYDQGDIIAALIKKGAKQVNLNNKGLCPIHVAVLRGSLKALKSIIALKVLYNILKKSYLFWSIFNMIAQYCKKIFL